MFDRVTVLETIDSAFAQQRLCGACGAPTLLRTDGGRVILQCSELGGSGILTRIGDFLMPHTQRVVIDLSEAIAA
jgi:hypothetical protein